MRYTSDMNARAFTITIYHFLAQKNTKNVTKHHKTSFLVTSGLLYTDIVPYYFYFLVTSGLLYTDTVPNNDVL